MAQPDVVFLGNQRSGSTFLRSYFTHHPDIGWTRRANAFIAAGFDSAAYRAASFDGERPSCYIDMYEGLGTALLVGDARPWGEVGFEPGAPIDPALMQLDHVTIAQRIKDTVPEAKILLIIRNQIDWLRSDYLHHVNHLPPGRRRFRDYLAAPEGKVILYAGLFHETIRVYREIFGAARVHVLLLEQMRDEQEQTLRRLCDFLALPFVSLPPTQSKRNRGKSYAAGWLARWGVRPGRMPGFMRGLKPLALRLLDRDPVRPADAGLLACFYAGINHHTARLLDIDLAKYGYAL